MGQIDFPALKAALSIEKIIRFLDLKGKWEPSGDFRCACPNCKPEGDRQLALGKSKRGEDAFTCWVSQPRAQGDLIYLVAHVKGIKQIEAAKLLQQHFMHEAEMPKRRESAKPGKTTKSRKVPTNRKTNGKKVVDAPVGGTEEYSILDHMQHWS